MTEKEDPKIDEKKEVEKKVVGPATEGIVIGAIGIEAIEAIAIVVTMEGVNQKRN